MMSKTDGWYEGDTLVMQETYSYKNAQHMAEFEELMSRAAEYDVEELGVKNVVVHYQDECVQVTARADDNPHRRTTPTLDRRHSPWQGC
jgi:carbonic anhydrase